MDIKFADAASAEIVAFIIKEGGDLPEAAQALDEESGGILRAALTSGRFSGKMSQIVSVILPVGLNAKRVVLLGGGTAEVAQHEQIAAGFVKAELLSGYTSAALHVTNAQGAIAAGAGARLAAYRFDKYFTHQKPDQTPSLTTLTLITDDPRVAEADFAPVSAAVDGTYLARDLMNEPPNALYPESFAERLKALEAHGIEVTILGEREMRDLGMGALLGVGQGSIKESQLGIMVWKGAADKNTPPVALLGKGVCFDTGGISLKPGPGMEDMRGDMGGAAAVTGTMLTLAKRKAKANVVGLVGLVENMPDGNAIRPGDILTSASGKTIEVQNTDAEGRLVLSDVLWYAQEYFQPKAMVDLATLTGAIIISLGHEYAGVFTPDDTIAEELAAAGKSSGETVWRLPMGESYDKLLKSKFADMRNIGGRAAGSITAAQFLKRFVAEDMKWAHLDIAGVAWKEGEKAATDPSWASGFGPRLLSQWIADNYED